MAKRKKDDEFLGEARERFAESQQAESDNRDLAIEDIKFENGEQWTDTERAMRAGRPCVTINKVSGSVKQIIGDQRQNRPRIKVRPVDSQGDVKMAELYTGLIRSIENMSDADVAYDTGGEQAVRGGYGFWRVLTEYAHDQAFEQDILIRRIVNPFSVYFDQSATRIDFSDANFCFVTETLSKDDFKNQYPDAEGVDVEQGKGESDSTWFSSETVRVAEYYYKEPATKEIFELTDGRVIEVKKAQTFEQAPAPIPPPMTMMQPGMMPGAMPPQMEQAMGGLGIQPGQQPQGLNAGQMPIPGQQLPGAPGGQPEPPSTQPLQAQPGAAAPPSAQPIKYVMGEDMPDPLAYNRSRKVKCEKVKWAKITGSEILEGPQEWAGSFIPIVPCLGEEVWIEGKRVLRSAIRFAKDPSRLYNWARSNAVETLALAPKQPFVLTKDEIDGYEKQWNEASTRPMPYLLYNEKGGGRPQRQQMSVSDTGALNEAMQSADDIKATTGLFDASLGAQGNEKSGRAIVARQRQSSTATFVFSDNQVRAVKYTGRILVDLIPKIYDTERVVRLMGDDGKETWTKINVVDKMTGKVVANDLSIGRYDVVIDAGPGHMTKRMEAAEGLVQLSQAAPQFAPILIPRIAKNLDWPEAQEIGDEIKQASQPQQAPQDPRIQADMQMKQMDLKAKEMDLAGQQMGLKSKEMDLQGKAMDMQGKQVERQHAAQEAAQNNDQHIYQVASKAVIDALKQLGVSIQ
jgi:hypothetical protein